jgi:hypothetical protein
MPRETRTPKQVLADQQKDADRLRQPQVPPAQSTAKTAETLPATVTATVLTASDVDTAVALFQNEDGGQIGRPMDFNCKEGEFRLRDIDERSDSRPSENGQLDDGLSQLNPSATDEIVRRGKHAPTND